MAILSGLRVVRVDADATDTGAPALDTPRDYVDPPTVQDYPITIRVYCEAYAGPDAYPVVSILSAANELQVATAVADGLAAATTALEHDGHTFA